MMTILTNIPPIPKTADKPYRTRAEAANAAVATIGPHARQGFEFETSKCDGGWRWRPTDEVPPPTAADLKASGGKKSILAMAAMIEGNMETAMATTKNGAVAPAQDNGIPTFLKRGDADCPVPAKSPEQQKAAVARLRKADDPAQRKIANPPDAKAAAKRADKRKAVEAKFEVTPEHTKAKAAAKKAGTVSKKPHPADQAALEEASKATKFVVSLFVNGIHDKLEASTVAEARQLGADMVKRHNSSRRPLVYGILEDGRSIPIPEAFEKETTAVKPHKRYDWNGAEEAAKTGKLPKAPDFSAPTHKPYRSLLEEAVALAKAKDIKGLKGLKVNPISSSPKAVDRYRKICVTALTAQAKAA